MKLLRFLFVWGLFLGLSGCFMPDEVIRGLKCDDQDGCLDGYVCEDGICQDPEDPFDAGAETLADAGSGEFCNNNDVCELINGETFLTCPADCDEDAPDAGPQSSDAGTPLDAGPSSDGGSGDDGGMSLIDAGACPAGNCNCDGICTVGTESAAICQDPSSRDCFCGDGVCDYDEFFGTSDGDYCPQDCCGDGICFADNENAQTCAADCADPADGGVATDGGNADAGPAICPYDSPCNCNGVCDVAGRDGGAPESTLNCPQEPASPTGDCRCNDGICDVSESAGGTCPNDCCPAFDMGCDCDGICEAGESTEVCGAADCRCGDDVCDATESSGASCPQDCSSDVDAGPPDSGAIDAGPPDAGPPPVDSGPPDAGPTDAGPTDAGPTDAGPPDAGPSDGGATAGADAGYFGTVLTCDPPDSRTSYLSHGIIVVEGVVGRSVTGLLELSAPATEFIAQQYDQPEGAFNLNTNGSFTYETRLTDASPLEIGVEIKTDSATERGCVLVYVVDPNTADLKVHEGASWEAAAHWRTSAPSAGNPVLISANTAVHALTSDFSGGRLWVETGAELHLQNGVAIDPILQATDAYVGGSLTAAQGALAPAGELAGKISDIRCDIGIVIVGPVTFDDLAATSSMCDVNIESARLKATQTVSWTNAAIHMPQESSFFEVNGS
jgi:hypothetical protein